MQLESKIEGILFYKNESVSIAELVKILDEKLENVKDAIDALEQSLSNRGITLIKKDDKVMLGTAPYLSSIIESIRREEISHELSKASLETLSIILYKGSSNSSNIGVTRHEIDYIRGVNSSFILRNLLVRGLIEKSVDKNDSRRLIYSPSFETLSYMGVQSIDKLPNYESFKKQLEEVITEDQDND